MTQQQMSEKIDAFIAENRESLIGHLGRLVAVRSVEDLSTAAPGAPYGAGPRAALDEALRIAAELGLETHDGDGYTGWAQVPGKEEGYLATITHVDIVPEGEGWDGDPYILRQKDGWLLARGVEDDKGPGILCLYAAKFLQECGEELRYGVRILLGCNEESGMSDIGYYLEREPQPLFCFTPDASFPVCNGEKGHQDGSFVSPVFTGGALQYFQGGIANNVIPDKATCLVKGNAAALTATDAITVQEENGFVRLTAKGIGGHAASPRGTVNAIGLLVDYLLENHLCTAPENQFLQLLQKLHHAYDGSLLDIAASDAVFDPLTCIGGIIQMEGGQLKQFMDIRFPTAITGTTLCATLARQAESAGATFAAGRTAEPFYISADSAPIQTLLAVYNEVSGRNAAPFTMGGGTYARHFARAVSFGPTESGVQKPDFVGDIHGANEGISIAELLTALKIYILSLWKLQQLDLNQF